MRRAIWTLLGIYFTLFSLKCTNPFSVRSPNPPELGHSRNNLSRQQNNPDSLIAKLKAAFLEKNSTFYQECLSDSQKTGVAFQFIPDKNESVRFINWSLQDEYNYFANLVHQTGLKSIDIRFDEQLNWNNVPTSTDTLLTKFNYQITVHFLTYQEKYQGQCLMKIFRDPFSQWYIFYWEDFQLKSTPGNTWSTLKANYRYR